MNFEERVHQYEYKLNDTEDQIIEYIVKNKADVINLSIQALAARRSPFQTRLPACLKRLAMTGSLAQEQLEGGAVQQSGWR